MIAFLFTTYLLFFLKEVAGNSDEQRLIDHLFSHYDKRVRPVEHWNQPVKINVEVHLKRMKHIDENRATVDIAFWIDLSWYDYMLKWSPSSYGNVKHIAVRATEIWTPDLILFSGWGVPEQSLRESRIHDAIIQANGTIFYYLGFKQVLPCLNVTAAGDLECNFGLGSWVMMNDEIHLQISQNKIDVTKYVLDKKYTLERATLEQKEIEYTAWNKTWDLVVGRINVKKK